MVLLHYFLVIPSTPKNCCNEAQASTTLLVLKRRRHTSRFRKRNAFLSTVPFFFHLPSNKPKFCVRPCVGARSRVMTMSRLSVWSLPRPNNRNTSCRIANSLLPSREQPPRRHWYPHLVHSRLSFLHRRSNFPIHETKCPRQK